MALAKQCLAKFVYHVLLSGRHGVLPHMEFLASHMPHSSSPYWHLFRNFFFSFHYDLDSKHVWEKYILKIKFEAFYLSSFKLLLVYKYLQARVHKNKSMQRLISSLWGTGTAKFQVTWLLHIVQKGVSIWQCCAVDRWLVSGAYRCTT